MNKINKWISVFVLAFFAFLSLPVKAADFYLPQDENDQNVVVGSTETYTNLYTAAPNLSINSNTMGDLTAVGGTVTFDGKVEKNLLLAGGNMTLGGSIGENAKIAGGNYSISSQIGGDLALAGGNVTVTEKALVEKDFIAAVGNLTLNAPILGKARIAGGNIYINSKIKGDVRIRASQKVTFGPKAEIAGKVIYYAPKEASFVSGSKVPNTEFNLVVQKSYKKELTAFLTLAFLIHLIAWLLAAFLAIRLFKNKILEIFTEITQNPWTNLGMGLVWLVCTPIVVILLLAMFLVGYYLAGILAVTYVLALMFANILSALMVGHLLMKYTNKSGREISDWQLATVGILILAVLKIIPVIGWAITAVFFLVSLGGMVKIVKKQFNN